MVPTKPNQRGILFIPSFGLGKVHAELKTSLWKTALGFLEFPAEVKQAAGRGAKWDLATQVHHVHG